METFNASKFGILFCINGPVCMISTLLVETEHIFYIYVMLEYIHLKVRTIVSFLFSFFVSFLSAEEIEPEPPCCPATCLPNGNKHCIYILY